MKSYILFPTIFVYFACFSNDIKRGTEVKNSNKDFATIVINSPNILKDKNSNISLFTVDFWGNSKLINFKQPKDTINIPCDNFKVITCSTGLLKSVSFSVGKNDTVFVAYDNDTIIVSNKKKAFISFVDFATYAKKLNAIRLKENDLLLNSIMDKKVFGGGMYSWQKKRQIDYNTYDSIGTKIKINNIAIFREEKRILDSLFRNGLINKQYLDWATLLSKIGKISIANTLSTNGGVKDFKNNYLLYEFINDSLIDAEFNEYRGMLSSNFINDVVLKRNKIKFSNTQYGFDYRNAFDSANLYITGRSLEFVEFQALLKIREQYSYSVFDLYKQKFLSKVSDTLLVNYIKNNFETSKKKDVSIPDSDVIKNSDGKYFSLSEITGKGKIVYVDFWASWCIPCREEMPKSIELIKRIDTNKIDIIFLSIDEDRSKWIAANSQVGLANYNKSYILVNPRESKIVNKNSIFSIPRYMIFDKSGGILYKDAPSASSKDIASILLNCESR